MSYEGRGGPREFDFKSKKGSYGFVEGQRLPGFRKYTTPEERAAAQSVLGTASSEASNSLDNVADTTLPSTGAKNP